MSTSGLAAYGLLLANEFGGVFPGVMISWANAVEIIPRTTTRNSSGLCIFIFRHFNLHVRNKVIVTTLIHRFRSHWVVGKIGGKLVK